MLPPAKTRSPAASRTAATRRVVVVFPLVPVMATMGVRLKRAASSISLNTSIPRPTASTSSGLSGGTPGLGTTASTPSSQAVRSGPKWQAAGTGNRDSSSLARDIWSSARASTPTTRAPRAVRNRAAARPVRASPSTRILLPRVPSRVPRVARPFAFASLRSGRTERVPAPVRPEPFDKAQDRLRESEVEGRHSIQPNPSAQLERAQREQRANDRHDPEPHDDLRFRANPSARSGGGWAPCGRRV